MVRPCHPSSPPHGSQTLRENCQQYSKIFIYFFGAWSSSHRILRSSCTGLCSGFQQAGTCPWQTRRQIAVCLPAPSSALLHREGQLRGRDLTDKMPDFLSSHFEFNRTELGLSLGKLVRSSTWQRLSSTVEPGLCGVWRCCCTAHGCVCTSSLSLWLWVGFPAPAFIPFSSETELLCQLSLCFLISCKVSEPQPSLQSFPCTVSVVVSQM